MGATGLLWLLVVSYLLVSRTCAFPTLDVQLLSDDGPAVDFGHRRLIRKECKLRLCIKCKVYSCKLMCSDSCPEPNSK